LPVVFIAAKGNDREHVVDCLNGCLHLLCTAVELSLLLHQQDAQRASADRAAAQMSIINTITNLVAVFVAQGLVHPTRNYTAPKEGFAPPEKVASVLQLLNLSQQQREKIAAVHVIFRDLQKDSLKRLQEVQDALSRVLCKQQQQHQGVNGSHQRQQADCQGVQPRQQQQGVSGVQEWQQHLQHAGSQQQGAQQKQHELVACITSQQPRNIPGLQQQQLRQQQQLTQQDGPGNMACLLIPPPPPHEQKQQQKNGEICFWQELQQQQQVPCSSWSGSRHCGPGSSAGLGGLGAFMDPEGALQPETHQQVARLTQQLAVIFRKGAWLEVCMVLCITGVFSWHQIALHLVHMHPYNTALGTLVGQIIAQQQQEDHALDLATVGARVAQDAVAAASARALTRPRHQTGAEAQQQQHARR
jgi:hypothetical protein